MHINLLMYIIITTIIIINIIIIRHEFYPSLFSRDYLPTNTRLILISNFRRVLNVVLCFSG